MVQVLHAHVTYAREMSKRPALVVASPRHLTFLVCFSRACASCVIHAHGARKFKTRASYITHGRSRICLPSNIAPSASVAVDAGLLQAKLTKKGGAPKKAAPASAQKKTIRCVEA